MILSQKCQYALRALFELAKHYGKGPVKIAQVAEAQAIPPRFLEVILSQLKQAGFVESRRGNEGGYLLVRPPAGLTVGEVIRFVEGPVGPVNCLESDVKDICSLRESCVFLAMWEKVRKAVSDIYDNTTFQSLVDEEEHMRSRYVASYAI